MSIYWVDGRTYEIGNEVVAYTPLDRLTEHLRAIFALDCYCDDDSCGPCIAEHALHFEGDHSAVEARKEQP